MRVNRSETLDGSELLSGTVRPGTIGTTLEPFRNRAKSSRNPWQVLAPEPSEPLSNRQGSRFRRWGASQSLAPSHPEPPPGHRDAAAKFTKYFLPRVRSSYVDCLGRWPRAGGSKVWNTVGLQPLWLSVPEIFFA
jgi:hypothetical protein